MKAGWRDAPLALWDSVVSNMQSKGDTEIKWKEHELPHRPHFINKELAFQLIRSVCN